MARWGAGAVCVFVFCIPHQASAAVSFVGQATATTTTSVTLPSFQAGDVAIVFAYRDSSATAPTVAAGWNTIASSGGNTNSSIIGYRILQAGDTTTGTWANATDIIVQIYRGTDGVDPVGASAAGGASNATITFPALTLQNNDGTSWVAGFDGDRNAAANVTTAPSGMTNRSSTKGVGTTGGAVGGHDTNAGVASWSSATVASGVTATGYRTYVVEIFQAPSAVSGVSSDAASGVYSGSATINGSVTVTNGGSGESFTGFAWGTNANLSGGDTATTSTVGTTTGAASFNDTISGLSPNTTYYYRAYAQNGTTGYGYGNIASFTTTNTLTCDFGSDNGAGKCVGFLTTADVSPFASPADWNNANNTIECIGAGGSGAAGRTSTGRETGGGGGAYAKITNFSFANPGVTTASFTVGQGGTAVTEGATSTVGNAGGNTWFNDSSFPGAGSDNSECAAAGGGAGQANTTGTVSGGAGGTTEWGQTTHNGGSGGTANSNASASGGGGAGGASANGTNGTNATSATATAGGQGDGTAGGTGGGGASGATTETGGPGNPGAEYGTAGSGGGGGAARSTSTGAGINATGGTGGAYGAGGGAAVKNSTTGTGSAISGAGGDGLIVITYVPSASAPTVTTNSAEAFDVFALLFGSITDNGGADATQRGFAYSTDSALVTGVSTTTDGAFAGTGTISTTTTGLSTNTTYYYRAYAANSGGTGYGTIKSFTTGNATPARQMRLFEGYKIKLINGTFKLYQQ